MSSCSDHFLLILLLLTTISSALATKLTVTDARTLFTTAHTTLTNLANSQDGSINIYMANLKVQLERLKPLEKRLSSMSPQEVLQGEDDKKIKHLRRALGGLEDYALVEMVQQKLKHSRAVLKRAQRRLWLKVDKTKLRTAITTATNAQQKLTTALDAFSSSLTPGSPLPQANQTILTRHLTALDKALSDPELAPFGSSSCTSPSTLLKTLYQRRLLYGLLGTGGALLVASPRLIPAIKWAYEHGNSWLQAVDDTTGSDHHHLWEEDYDEDSEGPKRKSHRGLVVIGMILAILVLGCLTKWFFEREHQLEVGGGEDVVEDSEEKEDQASNLEHDQPKKKKIKLKSLRISGGIVNSSVVSTEVSLKPPPKKKKPVEVSSAKRRKRNPPHGTTETIPKSLPKRTRKPKDGKQKKTPNRKKKRS